MTVKSQLGRMVDRRVGVPAMNQAQMRAMAAAAWHRPGNDIWLCVRLSEIRSDIREALEILGGQIYGKREEQ